MTASLDLGALSYTLKLNQDGFSEGFNKAKEDINGFQSNVKGADQANKDFQSSMRSLAGSLQSTGTSFENLDQRLRLWISNNRESASGIEINNKAIETNKTKMAELESQISKTSDVLTKTKNTLGESSEQYKKVENSIIDLELKYKSLEEENRRLATSNKEMEEAANPSFFQKLKASIGDTGNSTEELATKGRKSSSILTKAFGSIKSAVMNTAVPIVAGMGLQSLIEKSEAGQKSLSQMDSVLKSTGGAAGMSQTALLGLAQSQSQLTEYSKASNIATENLLLTFTNIGSKVFPDALKSVNDMSQALGQDTKESSIQLGKALNDPIKGITALSRVGVTFTEGQKNQIKAMVEAGNTAGAQSVILKELQREFGGSAEAAGKTFPGQLKILENQLSTVGTSVMGQLISPLTQLTTFTNANMPKIQSIATGAINGIITTFKTLGPIVLGIGQDVLKIASNIFPQLNSSSGSLGQSLLGLAKGGLTTVKSILDWFASHGANTKAILIGIGSAFATWKTITTVVTNINNAKRSIDNMKTAANNAKNAIGLLGNGFSKIGGFVKTAGSAMLDFGKATGTALLNLGKMTIELGKNAIAWIAEKAQLIATTIAEGATTVAQTALNLAMSLNPIAIVVLAITGLVAALVVLYNKNATFRSFINEMWSELKSVVGGAISAIIGFFGGMVSGIESAGNSIKNGFNSVVSWFESLPSRFYSFGSNMISSLRNGISSVMGTIAGVIEGGFNSAISFITSLPGRALGWGKDFINGLINGIKSMIGAVGDAVSGVADKITGILHHTKPDEGPMKDDDKWMPDFMQSLANGIQNNKKLVTNAIKSLATDVSIGMKLTPAMAGIGVINNRGMKANDGTANITSANGLTFSINHMILNGYKDVKKMMRDAYNIQQDYNKGRGGN